MKKVLRTCPCSHGVKLQTMRWKEDHVASPSPTLLFPDLRFMKRAPWFMLDHDMALGQQPRAGEDKERQKDRCRVLDAECIPCISQRGLPPDYHQLGKEYASSC